MVEGKRTDVSLFVLFLFLQALLELALLLETVLFCHLTLLLVSLHDTTLRAEVLQFAIEHLILAELTLQTAVVKRNLDAGLQANLVETLLTIAEHPGVVALELVFQSLANHLVSS